MCGVAELVDWEFVPTFDIETWERDSTLSLPAYESLAPSVIPTGNENSVRV